MKVVLCRPCKFRPATICNYCMYLGQVVALAIRDSCFDLLSLILVCLSFSISWATQVGR